MVDIHFALTSPVWGASHTQPCQVDILAKGIARTCLTFSFAQYSYLRLLLVLRIKSQRGGKCGLPSQSPANQQPL